MFESNFWLNFDYLTIAYCAKDCQMYYEALLFIEITKENSDQLNSLVAYSYSCLIYFNKNL